MCIFVCVCVRMFVTMIDLPHDPIPVLLHRPESKQLLCWLMFYGDGSVCVRACTAPYMCVCVLTHSVCIARSEVKVPLARVWILLS